MSSYHRIMLGRGSTFAPQCLEGGFIGTDFDINFDLTGRLPDELRAFNKEFIPAFLEARPDKTKIGAGLACGALWTVSKGVLQGDIVLSPDGSGTYQVGRVVGDYYYAMPTSGSTTSPRATASADAPPSQSPCVTS